MTESTEDRLAALRELVVAYFTAQTRKEEHAIRRQLMHAVAKELAQEKP